MIPHLAAINPAAALSEQPSTPRQAPAGQASNHSNDSASVHTAPIAHVDGSSQPVQGLPVSFDTVLDAAAQHGQIIGLTAAPVVTPAAQPAPTGDYFTKLADHMGGTVLDGIMQTVSTSAGIGATAGASTIASTGNSIIWQETFVAVVAIIPESTQMATQPTMEGFYVSVTQRTTTLSIHSDQQPDSVQAGVPVDGNSNAIALQGSLLDMLSAMQDQLGQSVESPDALADMLEHIAADAMSQLGLAGAVYTPPAQPLLPLGNTPDKLAAIISQYLQTSLEGGEQVAVSKAPSTTIDDVIAESIAALSAALAALLDGNEAGASFIQTSAYNNVSNIVPDGVSSLTANVSDALRGENNENVNNAVLVQQTGYSQHVTLPLRTLNHVQLPDTITVDALPVAASNIVASSAPLNAAPVDNGDTLLNGTEESEIATINAQSATQHNIDYNAQISTAVMSQHTTKIVPQAVQTAIPVAPQSTVSRPVTSNTGAQANANIAAADAPVSGDIVQASTVPPVRPPRDITQQFVGAGHSGASQLEGFVGNDTLKTAGSSSANTAIISTLAPLTTSTEAMTVRVAQTPAMQQSTPAQQVSVHIVQATPLQDGKMLIQLSPLELGQVEVRITVDNDNNATVRIMAESREAYDVLRADRVSLERSLNESGIKVDSGNLQFDHQRDEQFSGNRSGQGEADGDGEGGGESASDDAIDDKSNVANVNHIDALDTLDDEAYYALDNVLNISV